MSVSYLKPVLHLFNSNVLNPEEEDTNLTTTMKMTIMDYLNDKYSDPATDDLLDMASLLDPRFKTHYISNEKIEDVKVRAVSELESLLAEQSSSQAGATVSASQEGAEADPAPAKKAKKTLGSFFKKTAAVSSACSEKELIEGELTSYLQTPYADSETDPLAWWKVHEANFPRVSQLARKYLCIPATSAPSERAFSTGGNIVTCHRSALKPDAVDRLIFLAHNL